MKKTLFLLILLLYGCKNDTTNEIIRNLETRLHALTTDTVIQHYDNGNLIKEENFIKDNTMYKRYYYDNNNLNRVVSFDSHGNLLSEDLLIVDRKLYYNDQGVISYSIDYSDNTNENKTKEITYYDENGCITTKETYTNNSLVRQTIYDDGIKYMTTKFKDSRVYYNEYYSRDGLIEYAEWYDNFKEPTHIMKSIDKKGTYKHIYYSGGTLVKEEIRNDNNNTVEISNYDNDEMLISKEIYYDNRLSFQEVCKFDNDDKTTTTREFGIYLEKEQIVDYHNEVITKRTVKYFDQGKLSDSNITYYIEGVKTKLEYYNEVDKPVLTYYFNESGDIIKTDEFDLDGNLISNNKS